MRSEIQEVYNSFMESSKSKFKEMLHFHLLMGSLNALVGLLVFVALDNRWFNVILVMFSVALEGVMILSGIKYYKHFKRVHQLVKNIDYDALDSVQYIKAIQKVIRQYEHEFMLK